MNKDQTDFYRCTSQNLLSFFPHGKQHIAPWHKPCSPKKKRFGIAKKTFPDFSMQCLSP